MLVSTENCIEKRNNMEEISLYQFLQSHISDNFRCVRLMKQEDHLRISHLLHTKSGQHFVLRECSGSPEVYRKLMTVSCPYLPRIYEVAEEDGKLLILEEFIQGDSLQSILEYGLPEPQQARQIAIQLCEALLVLHGIGAVHRDVKPENIILRGDEAVLIDFDASRLQKQGQETDTVILGTAGYAAPEQYGISQTDGRADIYSLGVVMNVMLTGAHPSVRLAGGRMGHVIRRCTMLNPKQRYRDVRQLLERL